MGKRASIAVVVAALVVGVQLARARSFSGAASGCGPSATFLVWPHGHPALSAIGFPKILNPHVEVYLGFSDKWPDSRAGAYIMGGKPPAAFPNGGVFGSCLNYGTTLGATAQLKGATTITKQTAVQCTFSSGGVIDIVDRPGKVQVLLFHAGTRLLARADANPKTASLTVPAKLCKLVPSPGHPPR